MWHESLNSLKVLGHFRGLLLRGWLYLFNSLSGLLFVNARVLAVIRGVLSDFCSCLPEILGQAVDNSLQTLLLSVVC